MHAHKQEEGAIHSPANDYTSFHYPTRSADCTIEKAGKEETASMDENNAGLTISKQLALQMFMRKGNAFNIFVGAQ